MRRVRLTVAYDGTAFHGWQFQPGLRTVQGVLQEAIMGALGEEVRVDGSSRTDSGVHARGHACAFTTASSVPTDKLPIVLNNELPADVRVVAARDEREDFQPRFDSAGKHYHYTWFNGEIDDVFSCRYVSRVRGPVDIDAMRAAAAFFEGGHDFACLQNSTADTSVSTVRYLHLVRVGAPGNSLIRIDVIGNAFLYNMVRILSGTLLEIGQGRRAPGTILDALRSGQRVDTGCTAPASGLCLEEVFFSDGDLERKAAVLRDETFTDCSGLD